MLKAGSQFGSKGGLLAPAFAIEATAEFTHPARQEGRRTGDGRAGKKFVNSWSSNTILTHFGVVCQVLFSYVFDFTDPITRYCQESSTLSRCSLMSRSLCICDDNVRFSDFDEVSYGFTHGACEAL